MAKKKPNQNRSRGGRSQRKPESVPQVPDRRIMEAMMRQAVDQLSGGRQDTPLGHAQDLMDQAFSAQDERERIRLAKQALQICPDCADAYVLLAELAPNRKEALKLYEQGVAAGERALGPEIFAQEVGHFWGILETRPYMRARLGLAHVLWTLGRRDEAAQHLQDMLRLNPNDNQGIRYTLAGFFLFLDRDDDLAHLLEQYPEEGTAAWAYTRALLAFRRQGDTPEARQLLKEAKKTNKHVPPYLLGEKFPPAEQPSFYSMGDESEALEYIGSFLSGWKATPGAIAWLRQHVQTKKRKTAAPHPKGPLSLIKKWLLDHLPQENDEWQAEFRQMPAWIQVGGQPVRPWMLMVTSRSNDLVLAHDIAEAEPVAALLWDTLVKAMQYPAAGEPHRPTELQVRPDQRWESLRSHLEEIGIHLVVQQELDQMDLMLKDLNENIGRKPEPGLLDVPGMKAEQVGSFYEAAAMFFQQAPWKKVGYESALRVECERFQGGPWYAVLMGQSGLTRGLALYEDLRTLKRLLTGDLGNEESARRSVATSVTFGEEWEIPVADLEAAKRHGWKVARPDAYPSIFHKERGLSVRPPLVWELELMEGCLRAIPDFVNRRRQEDSTKETISVPVTFAELPLKLSWVTEDGS